MWLALARNEATFANATDSNGEDCKKEFRGSEYVQHLALYMASLVMAHISPEGVSEAYKYTVLKQMNVSIHPIRWQNDIENLAANNRPIHWESVELLAWLLKQDPPKMPEDDDDDPVYWNTEIAATLGIMPSIDANESPWESSVFGRSVKLYPSPLGSTADEWAEAASKLVTVKADLVAAVKAKSARWNE